jgi:hypothetical protein
MVARLIAFFAVLTLALAPAHAKVNVKEGFSLSDDKPVRIAVFRPDVAVGSLTAGGVAEPNAEWTADARKFMAAALESSQKTQKHKIVFLGEPDMATSEYTTLFRAVSGAILTHKMFPGNKLPTKKDKFDWTMGPGVTSLAPVTDNADYALFFYTYDQYGTAGRKAAQIFGALMGVGIVPGIHIGYAGMTDLKTGEIVWFNTDVQMGGDVRTEEGAVKRVGQLLRGFPGTPEPVEAAKK